METLEPGSIPDGWAISRSAAVALYGSVIVAEVLESMPHAAVVKGFRGWIERRDLSTPTTWGLPDFRAVRVMTEMTRGQMANALRISIDHIELIEFGILVPTMSSLLLMAERLSWPAGAFFRDALGWHHRTALGRKAGYPSSPSEREGRYPGWMEHIIDAFDALDDMGDELPDF